jgi:hypothetical protein
VYPCAYASSTSPQPIPTCSSESISTQRSKEPEGQKGTFGCQSDNNTPNHSNAASSSKLPPLLSSVASDAYHGPSLSGPLSSTSEAVMPSTISLDSQIAINNDEEDYIQPPPPSRPESVAESIPPPPPSRPESAAGEAVNVRPPPPQPSVSEVTAVSATPATAVGLATTARDRPPPRHIPVIAS